MKIRHDETGYSMYKINPEFKELLPELSKEEKEHLEQSLLEHGTNYAPIMVWDSQIVDGHNRFEIMRKHEMPFTTMALPLENKYEVIDWMIREQKGRRNLTKAQKDYYIGKRYENQKKMVGTNQYTDKKRVGDFPPPKNTAEKIAEQEGIDASTIKQNEKFAKGIDKLCNDLKWRVLNEEEKVKKSDIILLAGLDLDNVSDIDAVLSSYKDVKEEKEKKKDWFDIHIELDDERFVVRKYVSLCKSIEKEYGLLALGILEELVLKKINHTNYKNNL